MLLLTLVFVAATIAVVSGCKCVKLTISPNKAPIYFTQLTLQDQHAELKKAHQTAHYQDSGRAVYKSDSEHSDSGGNLYIYHTQHADGSGLARWVVSDKLGIWGRDKLHTLLDTYTPPPYRSSRTKTNTETAETSSNENANAAQSNGMDLNNRVSAFVYSWAVTPYLIGLGQSETNPFFVDSPAELREGGILDVRDTWVVNHIVNSQLQQSLDTDFSITCWDKTIKTYLPPQQHVQAPFNTEQLHLHTAESRQTGGPTTDTTLFFESSRLHPGLTGFYVQRFVNAATPTTTKEDENSKTKTKADPNSKVSTPAASSATVSAIITSTANIEEVTTTTTTKSTPSTATATAPTSTTTTATATVATPMELIYMHIKAVATDRADYFFPLGTEATDCDTNTDEEDNVNIDDSTKICTHTTTWLFGDKYHFDGGRACTITTITCSVETANLRHRTAIPIENMTISNFISSGKMDRNHEWRFVDDSQPGHPWVMDTSAALYGVDGATTYAPPHAPNAPNTAQTSLRAENIYQLLRQVRSVKNYSRLGTV